MQPAAAVSLRSVAFQPCQDLRKMSGEAKKGLNVKGMLEAVKLRADKSQTKPEGSSLSPLVLIT